MVTRTAIKAAGVPLCLWDPLIACQFSVENSRNNLDFHRMAPLWCHA